MLDLERQLAEWRHSMMAVFGERTEVLEELEAHLRDEIEFLTGTGLPGDEAFRAALTHLGSISALGVEFDKLRPVRSSRWKPAIAARWAGVVAALAMVLWLGLRVGQGSLTLLLAGHVLTVTIGYLLMFLIGGLGICFVASEWFRRCGARQREAMRRTVLQLATVSAILISTGIVLGKLWAKDHWGRYWAWDPKESGAGIILLMALGIMAAARSKSFRHRTLVTMALLGNVLTAWGWFGANAGGEPFWFWSFVASQGLILLGMRAIRPGHARGISTN